MPNNIFNKNGINYEVYLVFTLKFSKNYKISEKIN